MLIRRPGQSWHALEPTVHDERALQTLLAQSPVLLPSPGPGELAVATNFKIASTGPLDLLGVGVDGRIALIECGRQEGPGRRPMGGSALAVAAGLWRTPYEEFEQAFAARAGVPLGDAAATLARAGGLRWDERAFREAVTATLNGGRFQLILAVDAVSDEVRRVVAYLNAGARPGLTAVALGLRYLAEDGIEILLPTIYQGDGPAPAPTVASAPPAASPAPSPPPAPAQPAPAPPPPPPAVSTSAPSPAPAASPAPAGASTDAAQHEAALFAALETSCLPAAVAAVRQLYELARQQAHELQWGQGEHPALTAVFDVGDRPVGVWSCYTDLKPSFVVNFEWLVPHVAPERLERLASRLGQLQSVPERLAGLAEAGYRRRLALAVNAVLAQPGAADVIASAVAELIDGRGNGAGAAASASAGSGAANPPPPPPRR